MEDSGDHVPRPASNRSDSAAANDRLEHALGVAFRYLNRRDLTVSEMERHLANHDVEASVVSCTVETLCEQGCLDDARFARLFTADKRELEQWGDERIRRALRHRGIDRELVDSTLVEGSVGSELERALELLRRRFTSPPRDRRERERALRVMVRKGFDTELALDALAAYGREAREPSWSPSPSSAGS